MNKKTLSLLLICIFLTTVFAGCANNTKSNNQSSQSSNTSTINGSNNKNYDYSWKTTDKNTIELNTNSIIAGNNVSVKKSVVTIEEAGTYVISGDLKNGQIIVDTKDEEEVKLVLNGVSISSEDNSPIYIKEAENVIIILASDSINTLSDSDSYNFDDKENEEPNATIFSKTELVIYGEDNSTLTIAGNYNDGINAKDELIVDNADINIVAVDDGIRGKDFITFFNSTIDITAGGDAIKSDNDSDESLGYININDSEINIAANEDGISATTQINIEQSTLNIESGEGSNSLVSDNDDSTKGIKAGNAINISDGNITIDSTDDAIHSNGTITINSGTIDISSGDDGIHADEKITINGGDITIKKSYEAIESSLITLNNGTLYLTSSDDGFNVAGGNDGSALGRKGAGGFGVQEGAYLYLNGGYVYMNANGDGLDSNGSVVMTGGTVIVNGPTNNGNGAIDYNGDFQITGGTLIAAGSSGMAEAPGNSSTQYSILVNFSEAQVAGTMINIQDSSGNSVLTFTPAKKFQSIVLSSSELQEGETYTVYLGGSSTGTEKDSLYIGGKYTPGTENTTITISGITTKEGESGGMMGGGPGDRGNRIMDDKQMPTGDNMMRDGQRGTSTMRQMPPDMQNGNFEGGTPPDMPDGEFTPPDMMQ